MSTMIKNKQWFDENAVDIDFIRAHEDLTPRGPHHAPVSSADVLLKFREKAANLGIRLVKETGALKRDGGRYMYLAEVEDAARPDYALTVGFRQSSDTSMSFAGIAGVSVFICSNGCCNALIKPSKMRHTIGNVRDNLIDGRIDTVFSRFLEDKEDIIGQIELMKSTPLTNDIVTRFIKEANGHWENFPEGPKFIKNPLIGSTNLCRILEELENPSLNSHDDGSVFRLHNAVTSVTTHKFRNPSQAMMASRALNNLILGLIKPDFAPLGDVVDVEAEVVEE